jgi:predicted alpha/beta hydrolase family esterase
MFLFSKDDCIVPFSHQEKYAQKLPEAKKVVFQDRGHFKLEEFSEIVELIKSL